MDEFTRQRLMRAVAGHKQTHGHDVSTKELVVAGFGEELIKIAVQKKWLTRYQVTAKNGATENRYKIAVDWRTISPP